MQLLPAIRGNIGTWRYYVATMTFGDIAANVKKIDSELHKSRSLSEFIQRSISNNYLSIAEYIQNQEERFFNAIVLALYDGSPQWIEVELEYEQEEFFNVGFLQFEGSEKLFPVDGQHRVEGIKKALENDPSLVDEKIPVIVIGHKNTEEGRKKTRRVFSTLNRYAKPVSLKDIIALDEDDLVAIATRDLLEEYDLFSNSHIALNDQKAIMDNDKTSLTSIITLYQCNLEVFKLFHQEIGLQKSIKDCLKFRLDDEVVDAYSQYLKDFWEASKQINVIQQYVDTTEKSQLSELIRFKETGGHLVFRPVGLLPIVKAVIDLNKRQKISFYDGFNAINSLNLILNQKPWKQVLWNDREKIMITGSEKLIQLLLLYLIDKTILTPKELEKISQSYAAKINFEGELNQVLDELDQLS